MHLKQSHQSYCFYAICFDSNRTIFGINTTGLAGNTVFAIAYIKTASIAVIYSCCINYDIRIQQEIKPLRLCLRSCFNVYIISFDKTILVVKEYTSNLDFTCTRN